MSDVTILVGTTKGVFLIDGTPDRTGWSLRGPFCGVWPINHVIGDAETGTIWAAGGGDWQGAGVWRSNDGGAAWEALQNGLPDKHCFFTVLRQAMAVDKERSAGVYFGTNSGSVFASADEGDSWTEIARHLPTVLSVETLQRS